jgi:hypothetical protein
MKIIDNSSVIPERANIMYHIVTMKWFEKWQAFVGLSKKSSSKSPGPIN